MQTDAQEHTHRRADQPIAGRRQDHRHAGVFQAAQGLRADHLYGVEHLEGGGHFQEHGGQGDHRQVVGRASAKVQPGDLRAAEGHGDAAQADETHTHGHGDQARAPRRVAVAGAHRQADAHGRGHADAQGHHEGHRSEVEGDLVRRQRGRAERAHHQGHGVEQHGLEDHRHADREAQTKDLVQFDAGRPVEPAKGAVGAQHRGCLDKNDHAHKAEQRGEGGRQTRADDAQTRRAEMAENQCVAQKSVDPDARPHHPQTRARPAQRGGEVAQHQKTQRKRQAKGQHTEELPRRLGQGRILMQGQQDRPAEPHHPHHRDRDQRDGPQAHAQGRAHAAAVAGARTDDVRHHRRDRRGRSRAHQPGEEEHRIADRRRRQGKPAEPA